MRQGPAPAKGNWPIVLISNVVLSLVLCESAALAWVSVQDQALYYTRPARPVPPRWRLRREAMGEVTDVRLHPYLGYRYVGPDLNNHGFEDAHDYPFVAKEGQVVVGVFGGSVAWFLTRFEAQHHLMREILQRVPRFRGKEVVILNFATGGGFKQPQQMLALSYFTMLGQRFDAVVDISGFNEVASANQNRRAGVSLAMPNAKLMMPLAELATRGLSVEQLGLAYASVSHAQSAMLAYTRAENCPSALCNVVLKTYATYSWRSYANESARFEAASAASEKSLRTSFLHIDALDPRAEDKAVAFREMASIWADSAQIMNDLCVRRGVAFFEVLQPNQYHRTRRIFTSEEQRDAIAIQGRYREGVEGGYPLLAEGLRDLGSRGLRVLDAREVFDSEPGTVYRDDCCHLNDRGQLLLGKRIGEWVAQTLNERRAAASQGLAESGDNRLSFGFSNPNTEPDGPHAAIARVQILGAS